MPWAAISGISGRIAPALLGLSLLTGCGLPAPDVYAVAAASSRETHCAVLTATMMRVEAP